MMNNEIKSQPLYVFIEGWATFPDDGWYDEVDEVDEVIEGDDCGYEYDSEESRRAFYSWG